MQIKMKAVALSLACLVSTNSYASLADATVTMEKGIWKVLRTVDQMTDEVVCTGVSGPKNEIQLNKNRMFISIAGGIQSVTLRYGNETSDQMRLASNLEKEVRAIIVDGDKFKRLFEVDKIRYQTTTLARGLQEGQIDLVDLRDVHAHIIEGCPVPLKKEPSPPPAPTPAPEICSDLVKARMKAAGIKDKQIQAVCK